MLRLLVNRDFVLVLALGLGLFAGGGARWTQDITLPALGLVMTLSTMGVTGKNFHPPSALIKAGLWGLTLNYLLLGGLLLFFSRFFGHDQDLRDGLIILAAVPPAVAVIPFTGFLDGDSPFSLLATVGAYLGALLIMPLIAMAHWEGDFVSPLSLLKILGLLIVLPVAGAQVLRVTGLSVKIESLKGPITNWCFFIVTYSIVGLNSRFILDDPLAVLPIMAIAVATTFGLGLAIEIAGRLLGVQRSRLYSMVLLGTLKNYGLAGGLALTLFSQRTALPAVVSTTFMVVYIIWLGLQKRFTSRA